MQPVATADRHRSPAAQASPRNVEHAAEPQHIVEDRIASSLEMTRTQSQEFERVAQLYSGGRQAQQFASPESLLYPEIEKHDLRRAFAKFFRCDVETVRRIERDAAHKVPSAVACIGFLHEQALAEYERNFEKAVAYYTEAAKLGSAGGWYGLGMMYSLGFGGLQQSAEKADRCFIQATQLGHVDAPKERNTLVLTGRLAPTASLLQWIETVKAGAARAAPEALYQLGALHEYGCGVIKSDAEAAKCYAQAWALGHTEARNRYAALRLHGRAPLLPEDIKAVQRVVNAVEQGTANADDLFHYGAYHEFGCHVKRNTTTAFQYYLLSAMQGNKSAGIAFENLFKHDLKRMHSAEPGAS